MLGDQRSDVWRTLRRDVEDFLHQFRGRRIFYWPNPGNGGDSLIAAATYEAFDRTDIEIDLAGFDANVDGKVVVLAGGGNLVPYYDDMRKALNYCLRGAARIVVLPHTVRGHEELLARLDERCTLFVRDRESLDHVKSANPAVDVRLAHDMAFHLDAHSFLAREELIREGEPILVEKLGQCGLSMEQLSHWASVDMMRLDSESAQADPESDVDISDLFMMGVNPDEAPVAAWCFLRAISLANHVNTDRLHVGIGAALLGVPCTLRNNSYGKNSAVYEHSLKALPGIRLAKAASGETVVGRKLRLEAEDLRKALQSMGAELQERDASLEALTLKLADAHKALQSTRAELQERGASLEAMTSKLVDATTESEKLQREFNQIFQANATLHALLASQDSVKREAAEWRRISSETAGRLAQVQEAARALERKHEMEMQSLQHEIARGSAAMNRLDAILNSRSWRYTAPLRRMRSMKASRRRG